MKFTVIMASFLHQYPGSASNREVKFVRAVKSFISQTHKEKELIIVSDGCDITNRLWEQYFKDYENIRLARINKQPLYSGNIRNIGLDLASNDSDLITYLDSDDAIGKRHLEIINNQYDIDNDDWVYYDDYMVLNKEFTKLHIRKVETRYGSIGTSAITHKNPKQIGRKMKWSDGYGHDWIFILKLNSMGLTFRKLDKMPQYLVCHYYKGDF